MICEEYHEILHKQRQGYYLRLHNMICEAKAILVSSVILCKCSDVILTNMHNMQKPRR